MSWTERFKQFLHKDKTPDANPPQSSGDDALPGEAENQPPQEQTPQESEEAKAQKEFQEAKERFDELQAEYSALPQEYQKKFEDWSKQAEAIESDFKELEAEGVATEEEVRKQLTVIQEVVREAKELIASYEEKAQLLDLQREFKGVKGAEFLDEEKIEKAGGKIWELLQEYYKKGGKIDKATLRNKDFKELREEMGFDNEKEFQKFVEDVIEGSRDFTVMDLKEQDARPEQAGQKDFWGKVKTFGRKIGTAIGTNIAIGMVAGKGATLLGAAVFGMGTGGAGLLGLAGAAAITAGWRAAARHIEKKAGYEKYVEQIGKALQNPEQNKDIIDRYRANLRGTLQSEQLERLHNKKKKEQHGELRTVEEIREEYVNGGIKNRDELRNALQEARGSLATGLEHAGITPEEKAKQEKELEKIDAALDTLYMTASGLKLERQLKEVADKGEKGSKEKGTASGTAWEAAQGGFWGTVGRVAARLPIIGTAVAIGSGYKLGRAVEQTFLEGTKWYEENKDKRRVKAAKFVCRVGGIATLMAISGSTGVSMEFAKELDDLGLGGALSTEGKRLSAEFGFGGEAAKLPESAPPSQQGKSAEDLPEGMRRAEGWQDAGKVNILEQLGFKHTEKELSFNLAEKAHEDPNLGKLEQVFDRVVGAKYIDEFGKDKTLDNIEASKILNMSANLVKMAETQGEFNPLGDIGDKFKEAASYNRETHVLTIHDQAKFDAVLDKLKEHADDLAKENKLGGAEEYINRIKIETWEKIVKAHESGIKVQDFGQPEETSAAPAGTEARTTAGAGTVEMVTSKEELSRLLGEELKQEQVDNAKVMEHVGKLAQSYGLDNNQAEKFIQHLTDTAGTDHVFSKEDLVQAGIYNEDTGAFEEQSFREVVKEFQGTQPPPEPSSTGAGKGTGEPGPGGAGGDKGRAMPKIETATAGQDATRVPGDVKEIKPTVPSNEGDKGGVEQPKLSPEQAVEAKLNQLLPLGSDNEHVRKFISEPIGNYLKGQEITGEQLLQLSEEQPEKFKEYLRFRTQDVLNDYLKNPSPENLQKLQERVIQTEFEKKWGNDRTADYVWKQMQDAFGGKYQGALKALQELVRNASKGASK